MANSFVLVSAIALHGVTAIAQPRFAFDATRIYVSDYHDSQIIAIDKPQ